jgi:hypothetical protein
MNLLRGRGRFSSFISNSENVLPFKKLLAKLGPNQVKVVEIVYGKSKSIYSCSFLCIIKGLK